MKDYHTQKQVRGDKTEKDRKDGRKEGREGGRSLAGARLRDGRIELGRSLTEGEKEGRRGTERMERPALWMVV